MSVTYSGALGAAESRMAGRTDRAAGHRDGMVQAIARCRPGRRLEAGSRRPRLELRG
ncbi:hypothetical protein SAMN04489717_4483 [Actinopolymorpha singaporensis]|uniref:Uncharacterized protein n=1 Tax=Actinopolymorpha singaporensis TaxID=117157 RepID=A0A1H1WEW6_9ACTN|nr:hypothetical protein SAMN04489717_4483 [Actinopolymorpha singaporensis]